MNPVIGIQRCENQDDLDREMKILKDVGVTKFVEVNYREIVHPSDIEAFTALPEYDSILEENRKYIPGLDDETLTVVLTENVKLQHIFSKAYLTPRRAILYRNFLDQIVLFSFHKQMPYADFKTKFEDRVIAAISED